MSEGLSPPDELTVSLVVLSMGDRPANLRRALGSAASQTGVTWVDQVVVWNGCQPVASEPQVKDVALPENVGVPEGRNIGLASCVGDVVVFLDDDARFTRPESIRGVAQMFRDDDRLGAVGFRIVDERGVTARRHIPRPGSKGARVGGEVALFPGGAVAVRRDAFNDAGGYPPEFFFAMEESDLALGMVDAGWRIRYEPEIEVFHPRADPASHPDDVRRTARNRVLLARRRLPWVVAVMYVVDWIILTTCREHMKLSAVRALTRGTLDGLRDDTDRRPIRWRTVWTLVRLGRPPVI